MLGCGMPKVGPARKKINADNYEESAFKTLDLALIYKLSGGLKVLGRCSRTPPLYEKLLQLPR